MTRVFLAALAASTAWAVNARAEPPTFDSLHPAGGRRGSTVSVTASGKFGTWPVGVWTDSPSIHVSAGKDSGSLTFKIDADAPVGPHLVRIYTSDGAAAPRCFVVGDMPEIAEAEPNDEPGAAQAVSSMPVTINGELAKPGDVDCYAVQLDAGATLVASVQGRRIGSPIDPMLHLIDADGIECAFAHDGLGIDPLLVFHAGTPGKYVVRVSAFVYPPVADVKLVGAKGDVYRLNLTTGPFARFAMPTGVGRNQAAKLLIVGWNLGARDTLAVEPGRAMGIADVLHVPASGGDGWLRVAVGNAPEWTADDACKSATVLPVPVNVSGRIDTPGKTHRFRIAAEKGRAIRMTVRTGLLYSALDAVLRVEDPQSKVLAQANLTAGASEATLDWSPPAAGEYVVTVSDLFGKGGDDYAYRLEIGHPAPTVLATFDNHAYRLPAGGSANVKLKVARRDGYAGGLVAVATGLPPGVTATSAEVPPAGGEVSLALAAAADAKPANGVVRFVVLGTDPAKAAVFPASHVLRPEKDATQELIDTTETAWLTVTPTTKPATRPKE